MVLFKNVGVLLFVLCVISRLAQAEYEDEVQDDFSQDEPPDDSPSDVQDDNQDDVEGRELVIIKPGSVTDTMIFYTKICNCTCDSCDPPPEPPGPPTPPPIIITPPPIVITRPPKTKSTKRPTTPPSRRTTPKTPRTPPPPPPPPPPSRRTTPRTPSTKTPRTPPPPPPPPPPPSRRTTPKTPKPTTPPPPPAPLNEAEIVFIVDVRCGWAVEYVYKNRFHKLVEFIIKVIPKPRFGLTAYGGKECYKLHEPLTSDTTKIFGAAQHIYHRKLNSTQAALGGLFLTATDKRIGWRPGKAEGIPKIVILLTDKHIPANITGGTQIPVGDGTDDCKNIKVPKIDRVGRTLRDHGIAVFPLLKEKKNYDAWKHVVENMGMGIKLYGTYSEGQQEETIKKKLKFTLQSENRQKLKR